MTSSRAHTAHVELRYRPASDVLSGDVELGMLAAGEPVTHSPDADTHLTWFPVLGDGEVLAAFHVVRAAARWSQGGPTALPAPLARLVPHLVERGMAELATRSTPLQRVEVRVDASVRLPVQQLGRPAPPGHTPAEWLVEPADVAHTAASLDALADTISTTAVAFAEPHRSPALHFATTVRELASVVEHSQGRTAPGTSAAARAALLPSLPLAPHHRRELLTALTHVDDTAGWPTVWALADDLCATMSHSHAVG